MVLSEQRPEGAFSIRGWGLRVEGQGTGKEAYKGFTEEAEP